MKSFLKFTLASILGVLISLFFMFLIVIGIIAAASSEKPVNVKPHTVLLANFDMPIVDRDPENPFSNIDLMNFSTDGNMGLNMILENIDKAAADENIDGIFMDLTTISAGIASIEEIRNALIKYKESGKFLIAHADYYTQGSYYLASVADSIFLTPEGEFGWLGLSAQPLFFKKALDKLQIEAQIIRAGEYKSAAEPFMYEKLSKENREQITDYVNSIWGTMVKNIASSRSLDVAELNRLANEMLISNSAAALEHKFVDGLIYYDQMLTILKTKTSTEEKKNLNSVTLKKYAKAPAKKEDKKDDKKSLIKERIAVIYASGNIVTGEGKDNNMGSDKISKAIREARRDSSVKAIVLRVNSGGGSALASEVIWREVKLAAETKPLIASLGDVAASGGYYIVAPARKIIASPNTITGSIGVIGILPNGKDFLSNKLGITSDVVNTNDHSDIGSFLRPLGAEETAVIQKEVLNIYKVFMGHVAEGRNLTVEQVDKIGRGHVYTALNAKEIGLVDDFGGLDKAIELAAAEANITDYITIEYPKLDDPFEAIVKQISGDVKIRMIQNELGIDYKYYKQLQAVKSMKGIQAVMPFEIELF